MFPIIDKQRTGQRIRMLMKQQNITVKQIQEYLNLSCVQGIYHWLDGTSMPTIDNLNALSELFEVPMDYLELEAMRAKKAEERGGFSDKIFLEYVE